MDLTTITTNTALDDTPARPSSRRRGRRLLTSMLAVSASIVGLTLAPSSASAVSYGQSGTPGWVTPYVVTGQGFAVAYGRTTAPALSVPGPVVNRSSRTTGAQTVKYVIQVSTKQGRFTTSGALVSYWAPAITKIYYYTIPAGTTAVRLPAQMIPVSGYASVALGLSWFSGSYNLGTKTINYTSGSDYRCNSTYIFCTTGAGYVYMQ